MSNRKIRRAVSQVADMFGAIRVDWKNGTRHEMATIRMPGGRNILFGISMGMNFDEMRVKKTLKGILKKATLEQGGENQHENV